MTTEKITMDGIPIYHLEIVRDATIPSIDVFSPKVSEDIFHKLLDRSLVEQMIVMHIDINMHILGLERVGIGSLHSVSATAQEVFRGALLAGATYIAIAHNHPTANMNAHPSDQDIIYTSVTLECSALLGIKLLDHYIIAPNGTSYSMFENNAYLKARLNNMILNRQLEEEIRKAGIAPNRVF